MVHSFGLSSLTPLCTAHILRLLATHHILREVSPDVFTLNRISSLVDSGKSFAELKRYKDEAKCVSFIVLHSSFLIFLGQKWNTEIRMGLQHLWDYGSYQASD
jgi:hypothetical protein